MAMSAFLRANVVMSQAFFLEAPMYMRAELKMQQAILPRSPAGPA
jgi:hypothetical protein